MKSPQQALFDEIFKISNRLGYDTYDVKPMSEVDYPFVELENTQEVGTPAKLARIGIIPITLSVWGLHTKRGQVSEMAEAIYQACYFGIDTTDYSYSLNVGASNLFVSVDTSTNTKLVRATLQLEFNFS